MMNMYSIWSHGFTKLEWSQKNLNNSILISRSSKSKNFESPNISWFTIGLSQILIIYYLAIASSLTFLVNQDTQKEMNLEHNLVEFFSG
uniref:Uncharacterized protein n=1 Tax=Lactuca sativa TaxID=4236 RepID=A0A9R1W1F2_LACSA|nr:hypothetical protein LSAT_V11C300153090 [Lactuca sativa]